jgi:hypothetical protein
VLWSLPSPSNPRARTKHGYCFSGACSYAMTPWSQLPPYKLEGEKPGVAPLLIFSSIDHLPQRPSDDDVSFVVSFCASYVHLSNQCLLHRWLGSLRCRGQCTARGDPLDQESRAAIQGTGAAFRRLVHTWHQHRPQSVPVRRDRGVAGFTVHVFCKGFWSCAASATFRVVESLIRLWAVDM